MNLIVKDFLKWGTLDYFKTFFPWKQKQWYFRFWQTWITRSSVIKSCISCGITRSYADIQYLWGTPFAQSIVPFPYLLLSIDFKSLIFGLISLYAFARLSCILWNKYGETSCSCLEQDIEIQLLISCFWTKLHPTNCLRIFDHFVGLVLKG